MRAGVMVPLTHIMPRTNNTTGRVNNHRPNRNLTLTGCGAGLIQGQAHPPLMLRQGWGIAKNSGVTGIYRVLFIIHNSSYSPIR